MHPRCLPCDEAGLPCEETSLPCDEASLPCEEASLPCETASLPCEEASLPCEAAILLCDEASLPCDEASLPCDISRVIDADLASPLVFNALIDTTNMANIVLIDSTLADKQVFYDSANANTFPIIYDYNSKTDDLLALFRQKFPASSIQRISLVFHDRGPNLQTPFMNNSILFQESDLEVGQTCFSENLSFLISCIKEFHVSHIDFLACNTLQYSNWKSYYALLASQTSVVVGASNDATGNMQHGGDWIMESTSEDVMNVYFNANISNYVSLLASSIPQSGGTILLQMNPANGLYVQYSQNGGSSWTDISGVSGANSWPVTFTNSTPAAGTILTIKLVTDISMSTTYTAGTSGYFIAGSQYVTFDGSSNYVRINGIASYPGFIRNGTSGTNGQANVVVQNFNTNIIGSATLTNNAGWLCQTYFGRGVSGNSITGCTNLAAVNAANAGGILGSAAGGSSGIVTITNCTNSGIISATTSAGGIAGSNPGISNGSVTFTNCTNSGTIAGSSSGGIAGPFAGFSGSVTFTNCTNSGTISANSAGGIAGQNGASFGGSLTFTGCTNSGTINGQSAGGITGGDAGSTNGLVTLTNCFSSGTINGAYAGGIAGGRLGNNTSQTCAITGCYSTGNINGNNAGGIVGVDVGYNNSVSYTPVVNITNSYSLGNIATTTGGICGGYAAVPYTNKALISISNCYSYGTLTGTGAGLVAVSLTSTYITLDTTGGTYIAAGTWSDASANAALALTGTPTNINTNNPGLTWAAIGTNAPYILSLYNAALYSPDTATASSPYTSAASVFGSTSGYTYTLVNTSQVGADATTRVLVSKGTGPYYNSYNFNTFTFTNSAGSTALLSFINSSNGQISYDIQSSPLTISADGATQSVYLRMSSDVMQYSTDNQVSWDSIPFTRWPVTITNGSPSSILRVVATQALTISNSYGNTLGYFIAGSSYITFDGSGNNMNINNITNYPGLIQNGTSGANGFANVVVQNFTTTIILSTLATSAGWFGQSYFGKGILGNEIMGCVNTGAVNANYAGGIVGAYAGSSGGLLNITNCSNVGTCSSSYTGGIAGYRFGYNTSNTCAITGCYSTGNISGSNAGGIVGADVGYNNNTSYTPVINITNSYSLGTIATSCGGICGGTDGGVYTNTPSITITNCYSAGTIVNANSGIVSTSYPKPTTQIKVYAAAGGWVNSIANDNLTGAPTNFNTPGITWTMIVPGDPYVLSLYNAAIYTSSSVTSTTPYTSAGSVFGSSSGYSYIIININQDVDEATTKVFAYKGTAPNYYSYNYNTFTLTDTNGVSSPGKMSSSIAFTTGVLTISKSANNISVDGSGNSIYLRMNVSNLQYSVVGTAPVGWTTISTWPMTLTNSNSNPGSTSVLRVVATQSLSISSSTGGISGFFIAGSPYITFDGSGNTITISSIPSYPGLIQNGSTNAGTNGFANVVVENFITTISGTSTLASSQGWLCQQYFGRNVLGNAITNCTNSSTGLINSIGGGIVGRNGGSFGGSLTFINCTNNAAISTQFSGGIAGALAGYGGSVTFTNCANTGEISGSQAGGISASQVGQSSGSAIFIGCTNSGTISGSSSSGITSQSSGRFGGLVTITNCTNSGDISGTYGGGIVGQSAGFANGLATLTNCFSTGVISGQYAGGIAGSVFAYNTNRNCVISQCYSTGNISGSNAGGIVGTDVGYNDNASYTPVVNITNSYSLGTIAATCGGICGGIQAILVYTNTPSITITNCFSYGTIVNANSGIVSTSYPKTTTQIKVYAAAGGWVNSIANANLTGAPTNFNTPGITWTMVSPGNPYVLSLYNAEIYSSSSVTSTTPYTSAASVFGSTGYTYIIININQDADEATTKVFAYKGTAPNYNSYNYNTFTLTDTNGVSSPGKMSSSIASTTGVLTISKSANNISVNGSGNSIYLRMSGFDLQYSVVGTAPVGWTTIPAWPMTLTNSNPGSSSVLRVVATQALSISSSTGDINGYFIAGSPYITFDGSGNTITISSIPSYPGLIQNGSTSAGTNGFANVVVQNFTTAISGTSTLATGAGWLCQGYFGRNVSGNAITNCTNSSTGLINTPNAGGIAGQFAGSFGGSLTFINCTNSGAISGSASGGISGAQSGQRNGLVTFTNCTNSGTISGSASGGISGISAGRLSGSATFINCTNSGAISGSSGGISGGYAGSSGSATFTNCANSGIISGQYAGGIAGYGAGIINGLVTLTNCFSTGLISGQYAGGITGDWFGNNTSRNCVISQCYNTGDISGNNAGGIVGGEVGYTDNATIIPNVNITNCYSLGAVSTTAGGICGGSEGDVYAAIPNITITNCYSSGTIVDANSGLVAVSLTSPTSQINLTTPNTYVADGLLNWSDASANANLTGTPTNISTDNPGSTWTMIACGTPYVLSGYNAALYSPDSASTSSSTYTSAAGLFSPGYNYQLIYTDQVDDEITAHVFVSKGTAPYYSEYNFNTFILTTTLSGLYAAAARMELSPGTSVTINSSTGVLYFILPTPPPIPTPSSTSMRNVPMISGGGGSFWFGMDGFLFKRKGGGGARRSTKMAPGGNTTCNGPTYIYNKYNPGNTGIGAQSTAVRRAKNIKAAVCGPKIPCGQFYNYLGLYDNYTGNPNGYVIYPRSNF